MKELTFTNGDTMPTLGLGTWKSAPGEVGRAIEEAVE
ncbi:MAG: aldo/keto reductase, partial [Planctomycetota bacterium]|nr:aldo/keto reductase [Planctomycetota bacterium]